MKIKINKGGHGGPSIFLTRLEREMERRNLISEDEHDFVIGTKYIETDKKFILRLDGVDFERFSAEEFSNFLRYRWKPRYNILSKANDMLCKSIGKNRYEKYITPKLTKFWFNRRNRFEISAIEVADFIVYQSKFSKDSFAYFCEDYGKEKHTIIHNGVDLDQFSPNRKNNHIIKSDDDLRLLAAGKFRIHKRLQETIKVLEKIIDCIPKTKLYILGEVDRQTLRIVNEIIEKKKLKDYVNFMGKIPFDELPAYYACMDIMIYPSWLDPCPNVVVEALASGVPIVCPDTGGTPELVGEGGIIIKEDYEFGFEEYYNIAKIPEIDLGEYVEAILKIYNDLDFHSQKARKRARDILDIRKIADKYVEVCRDLINE